MEEVGSGRNVIMQLQCDRGRGITNSEGEEVKKKKKKFEWLSRKTCEQNISFGLEANGLSKHEIESIETESILGTVAYGSEGRPVR